MRLIVRSTNIDEGCKRPSADENQHLQSHLAFRRNPKAESKDCSLSRTRTMNVSTLVCPSTENHKRFTRKTDENGKYNTYVPMFNYYLFTCVRISTTEWIQYQYSRLYYGRLLISEQFAFSYHDFLYPMLRISSNCPFISFFISHQNQLSNK